MEHGRSCGLGIAVQNIWSGVRFVSDSYDLPLMVRIGMNYSLIKLIRTGHTVLLLADLEKPADNEMGLNLGMEYNYEEWAFLRIGYKPGNDLDRLAFGAGIRIGLSKFNKVKINYAFVPYENLGNTHRIGLLWVF
ncbi:MAG: hypothetical protein PHF84_13015 [bacterium]|nr:hypothetical protein [bacterium]